MHTTDLLPKQEFSGITVFKFGSSFVKGTTVQEVADGTAVTDSETWTQDGKGVNREAWCRGHGVAGEEVFYADPVTGAHGWACSICRKLTQTG